MRRGNVNTAFALLVQIAIAPPSVGDSHGEASLPINTCGAASLAVCLRMQDKSPTIYELDKALGGKGDRSTLLDLKREAERRGFWADCVRIDNDYPPVPFKSASAILPIVTEQGLSHFVAAIANNDDLWLIVDYPNAPQWVNTQSLRDKHRWDGTILYVGRAKHEYASGDLRTPLISGVFMIVVLFLVGGLSARYMDARCQTSHQGRRRGFSILELVVVLGIISLLLALILPAVQSSRESARRASCLNHLRQIGIALHAIEASEGHFPATSPRGTDGRGRYLQVLSPHVLLLPWLDHRNLFEQYDFDEYSRGESEEPPSSPHNSTMLRQRVPVFECPSDVSAVPRSNYRICCGTSTDIHWYRSESGAHGLQGFRTWVGNHVEKITDGLSQTIAFSERIAGDQTPGSYTASRDVADLGSLPLDFFIGPDEALATCSNPYPVPTPHFSFAGSTWALGGYAQTWYNHVAPPNSRIPDCSAGRGRTGMYTARSFHRGGVHALYGDGAVHVVSDSIDLKLWRALSTRSGGEGVPSAE